MKLLGFEVSETQWRNPEGTGGCLKCCWTANLLLLVFFPETEETQTMAKSQLHSSGKLFPHEEVMHRACCKLPRPSVPLVVVNFFDWVKPAWVISPRLFNLFDQNLLRILMAAVLSANETWIGASKFQQGTLTKVTMTRWVSSHPSPVHSLPFKTACVETCFCIQTLVPDFKRERERETRHCLCWPVRCWIAHSWCIGAETMNIAISTLPNSQFCPNAWPVCHAWEFSDVRRKKLHHRWRTKRLETSHS